MGSDDVCLRPVVFHLNGLLPDGAASVTRMLDMDRWTRAEERTAELIAHIQPDKPSWEHRNAIASYVQRLIAQYISCVVFSYGSVPLKTYLPDGDIDLTVFSRDQTCNDNWATEVRDILEKEVKNEDAEYCVREVQLIHAEVKLVKCLVDNIAVDISFSQLSGLRTLCFLEEVDRYIGQNHLFKRSIILIKAWCYYESRLLGAYHGLISTYALETLILYIFHVFNNSFAGPLEVLYRFLEFFSKFDWENFCISLLGPVPIGSLPDMTADPPRQDDGTLLLSKMFLHACSLYYSVLPSTHVKEKFVSKHLNIIDFLRTSNNLGRSVSKGNFFRIRSAFAFGAQRLARLLECPKEFVVVELNRFFVNTWDRHGKVRRPDTRIHVFDLVQEEPEQIVQKRNIKQTNLAFEKKGNMRLDSNPMFLNAGEKSWRSEVLQNEVQFGHQFARTFSCPELTNPRSKLVHEVNTQRGRKQDSSISVSDRSVKSGRSKVADCCTVNCNAVDSSTRENSPSDSYDGDVDSASTSSRYAGDYVVGEDIHPGFKPIQKSANVMHFPWIHGRQFVGPEAGWNLNLFYPHGLPLSPAAVIGRLNDNLQAESSNQLLDNHGLWDDDVCSSAELNTENGVLDNEYMEKKQYPASVHECAPSGQSNCSQSDNSLEDSLGTVTTMDAKPVDDNIPQNQENVFEHCHNVNGGKNGVPLLDAETTIPHAGALQFPIPNVNYPSPNWVFHMPLQHPSWPMAANNYPPFPVTFLPAGFADPYASTLPYPTYTCQFNGNGDNLSVSHSGPSLDSSNKSIHYQSKMINGLGSAENSEECTSDILSGDISSHVSNMLYGRSCQSIPFQGPLFCSPSIVPHQYLQGQFLVGGDPGRSSIPSANDSVLPETPLLPVSHQYSHQRNLKTGYQYYPKGINGYGGTGTGTYLPNLKSGRDFQTPNSRYHRGNYRNHRKEQNKEREVNSNFNSRPRYGGRSRKWEKPNANFDRSAGRNHRTQPQWETYGNYSHPTYPTMVHGPTTVVYPFEPNSGYGSLEHPPQDYANSSSDQPSSPSLKGSQNFHMPRSTVKEWRDVQ